MDILKLTFLSSIAVLLIPITTVNAEPTTNFCQSDPTLACIKSFLTENISIAQNNDNWTMAEDLTRAGLYEDAKTVLATTKSGLGSIAVRNLIIFPVTEKALNEPSKIADLDYYDKFFAKNPELSNFIPTKGQTTNRSDFYHFLAFSLLGMFAEGGQQDYVRYTENAAIEQFKPTATSKALMKRWSAEIDKLPEPIQTNHRASLAEMLIRMGNIEEAKKQLNKTKIPNGGYIHGLSQSWIKLGEYDRAIEIAKPPRNQTTYNRAKIAKAEHLATNKDTAGAITLLSETAEEIKTQGEIGRWESMIRVIRALKEAGAKDQAIGLAEYLQTGIEGTPTGNLEPETAAQAYRAAGDIETARTIMRQLTANSKKKCTVIGDEINGHQAVELYLLGMTQDFEKMIKNICAEKVLLDTWLNVYSAARDADVTLPNTDVIISSIPINLHADAYNSFAATHFKHGEKDQGVAFLTKAVASAGESKTAGALCATANMAHFSGHPELLQPLIIASTKVANRPPPPKNNKYDDFLSKFLEPEEKPVWYILLTYRQFLETAACFNQIEMHSIKK